ncbi:MAG: YabP/YqfC family sporulation protein [Clostridia bacterium]|nr:YabP/YqfC family sporulation protein [Clostridia bacterium]
MNRKKSPSKSSPTDPLKFHILSNRYIVLDGHFEITEYTNDYIEFCSNSLKTRFYGSNITVKELGDESADIEGLFVRIEFS